MEDKYPYRVFDSSGTQVLYAPECCRHDNKTEKSLLESGHTIRLHGRRITKRRFPMSNKLQIPEDIRVDLTGATPGQIAALQELSVRLAACQNDKESLYRQVEKLNNRLAAAQSEREYFRSRAAFFQEASSHCPHIISVSGYKAFHGTMCIAPSGQTPYELTSDWLYKPEFDCWYGKGRSFPASVCTVSEA